MLKQRVFSRFGFIAALFATIAVTAAVTSHAQEIGTQAQAVFGPLIASSCSNSNPCLQWTNSSTGAGVKGISSKGKGIVGQTNSNSTTSSNGQAGVLGSDASISGTFDAGVKGTSVRGTGVTGSSTSGAGVSGSSSTGTGVSGSSSGGPAVSGNSSGGVGVSGVSLASFGVFAKSSSLNGVYATSAGNDGINASTTNNSSCSFCVGRSGIYAHDDSTDGGHLNVGVAGASTNGIGVEGVSSKFVGVNAVGGDAMTFRPALSIVGNPPEAGIGTNKPDLIDACPNGTANPCDDIVGDVVFSLDQDGSVIISGIITTGGSCNVGCASTRTSGERRVRFYTPQESLPTVEDFGEAQLVDGQAYVRLDSKFSNVVDQRSNYLVFITPEGEANTLYVTQKSPSGFVVREIHGGRSTIAFSYRIVAKPFGSHETRLPMVELPRLHPSRVGQPRLHV